MTMRKIAMPVPYKDKDIKIMTKLDNDKRPITGKTNKETLQFMKGRYLVIRDFIPKEIIDFTMDVIKTMEASDSMGGHWIQENDIIFNSPQDSLKKSFGGHTHPAAVALHRYVWEKLKGVIDLDLKETYAYTRKYIRGAYLKSHTDRPSCEVSATLCLDYKSDDGTPWKIWCQPDRDYVDEVHDQDFIYNHTQGRKTHKERIENGAVCVSLEPGDIMLYQGPNIPHWRDYFVGEYSYHMFLHFYNEGGNIRDLPHARTEPKPGMPDPVCVLQYDGRANRYVPCTKMKSEGFDRMMDMWNSKMRNDPEYEDIKLSNYVNNYNWIEENE